MKKLLKLIVYALIMWMPYTSTKVLQQNIALLVDNTETGYAYISGQLGVFLCQKICPVVVHKHTISVFLSLKKEFPGVNKIQWLDENWLAYFTGANFYILIPKGYTESLEKEFGSMPVSDLVGLNVPARIQTFAHMLQHKAEMLVERVGIEAAEITALLRNGPENSLKNILLAGHGGVVTIANREELPEIFASQKYNEPFDIKKYRAKVAGFDSIVEFRKLLNFFNTLNINFLYYTSCYAGGYLLYMPYVKNILNNNAVLGGGVKPSPYTIVVGSSTDAAGMHQHDFDKTCAADVPFGYFNPQKFFGNIVKYTNQYLQEKSVRAARFSDTELQEILLPISAVMDYVSDEVNLIALLPQVKFPNTEKFMYFTPDSREICIITEAKVQKALRENKPIEITISRNMQTGLQIPLIALPVQNMPITIKIVGGTPRIVSLLAGTGLQVIDTLKAPSADLDDMLSSMKDMLFKMVPRYFFIKNLVTQEKTYNNILIGILNNDPIYFFIESEKIKLSIGGVPEIIQITDNSELDGTDEGLSLHMIANVLLGSKWGDEDKKLLETLYKTLKVQKNKQTSEDSKKQKKIYEKSRAVQVKGGVPLIIPPYAQPKDSYKK